MPSSLRWIINSTIILFFLFLIAYVSLQIASIVDQNADHKQMYNLIAQQLMIIAGGAWGFVRPFLQLILVLGIVDWILGRWGISWQSNSLGINWNIQTIIALIVIGAFAIAALGGLSEGVGTLKDLALVVVGFYFGSQRKSIEMQTDNGKVTVVEEHENEVKIQTKEVDKSRDEEEQPSDDV